MIFIFLQINLVLIGKISLVFLILIVGIFLILKSSLQTSFYWRYRKENECKFSSLRDFSLRKNLFYFSLQDILLLNIKGCLKKELTNKQGEKFLAEIYHWKYPASLVLF